MTTRRHATAVLLTAASILFMPAGLTAQRHCGPSRVPAELPAVDALLDSAAIVTLIARNGTEGVLRFSIVADAGGAPRVYPIAGDATSAATEWLTRRIEESLRTGQKSAVAWGVRLTASADSTPVLSLDRSEYCGPQMMPSSTIVTMKVIQEPGSPRLPRQMPIAIYEVSAAGDVRNVTFMRSSNRDLEAEIRRVSVGRRYHPARIDGIPVASADTTGRR